MICLSKIGFLYQKNVIKLFSDPSSALQPVSRRVKWNQLPEKEVIQMKARETRFLSVTQLLRYKYYRSILLYSVALVFVLVLIVGLLFSSLYNSYSQDLMQNYAEDMLAQRVYSAELLGEEMESLATAIYTDQEEEPQTVYEQTEAMTE